MSTRPTVHANCVAIGECGALIRGASGAGKSSLSAAMIACARAAGFFARLVADDRVRLEAAGGRLIASPPAALAGLIERRGVGPVLVPYAAAAVVRLVIDIEDAPRRVPDDEATTAFVEGVSLPRISVGRGDPAAAELALFGVGAYWRGVCGRSALAFAPRHENIISSAPHAPLFGSVGARVAAPGDHDPERKAFCAETA